MACRQTAPGSREAAPAASPSTAVRVLATLPEFALENERGESTDLSDLYGTVWVADFVFTRCAPCDHDSEADLME